MNRNPYTYLGWIALLVMPLSASINFGWHAYTGMVDLGVTAGLAKAGGISLAVGLELLGIIAGHLAIKSYSIRNYTYLGITVTATVLYVVVGTFEMVDIPFARFVPLLASCLYVLVGIQSEIDEAVAKATITEKRSAVIDYRQQEARAQRDHEARMKQMELDAQARIALETKHEDNETAVKLARIEAKKRTEVRTDNQTLMDTSKTDWRTLSDNQRSHIARLTPEQIINQYNVSSKTAGRWLQKAGQLQPEVSTNGHVK